MKGVHYSPAQIEQARQIDLLSYLQSKRPSEIVRLSARTYCLKAHDSLQMSNGKWYWFSRGFGGKSAIDYLMTVEWMTFVEALEEVLGTDGTSILLPAKQKTTKRRLLLPERNDNNDQVVRYLQGRGIHPKIIQYCIDHGLLYESKSYQNAVFIGYGPEHVPRYAAIRSTKSAYKGEATGSDKHFSFSIADPGDSGHLHLFESAIDLLSFATIQLEEGRDWKQDAFLSLAGVFPYKRDRVLPVALEQFLKDHSGIKEIHLHLDNDETGRGAALAIKNALEGYIVHDEPPETGKDINDCLMSKERRRRGNGHLCRNEV